MSISEDEHVSESQPAPARRVEIFTGAGRRRSWTDQEKAAIVAESFEDGARACHVARRRGLTPQQLFTWRREARCKAGEETGPTPFVPAYRHTLHVAGVCINRIGLMFCRDVSGRHHRCHRLDALALAGR